MDGRLGLVLGVPAVVVAIGLGYMATTQVQYLPKSLWSTPEQAVPLDEGADRPWSAADCGRSSAKAMDDFTNDWYSGHWRAAEEPSLFLQSQDAKSMRSERFTWLRSFYAPVFVRLDWLADGQVRMTAKELTGAGGYEPGEVGRMKQRLLSGEELATLDEARGALKPYRRPAAVCSFGVDGARWLLESSAPGEYVFIDRWTPESGPVHDYALKLLALTGWAFDPVYWGTGPILSPANPFPGR